MNEINGGELMTTVLNVLTKIIQYLLIILMGGLVIVVFAQVFFRYVLEAPLPWSEELARYLLIYITFLGSGLAINTNEHILVDFFQKLIPKKFQHVLNILINLIILFCCVLIVYYGITFTAISKNGISPAMQISISWIYVSLPIMGLIMIIYLIPILFKQIRNFTNSNIEENLSSAKEERKL